MRRHCNHHATVPVMLSPLLPWQPQPSYTTVATWAVHAAAGPYIDTCSCVWAFALPLGSFIKTGASGTKWTLLMAVIKRQQGIGTQTLQKETQMSKTQSKTEMSWIICFKVEASWSNSKVYTTYSRLGFDDRKWFSILLEMWRRWGYTRTAHALWTRPKTTLTETLLWCKNHNGSVISILSLAFCL